MNRHYMLDDREVEIVDHAFMGALSEDPVEARRVLETLKPEARKIAGDAARCLLQVLDEQANPPAAVHTVLDTPRLRVNLSRGQKGTYGHELTVEGQLANKDDLLAEVEEVDRWLTEKYGSEGRE